MAYGRWIDCKKCGEWAQMQARGLCKPCYKLEPDQVVKRREYEKDYHRRKNIPGTRHFRNKRYDQSRAAALARGLEWGLNKDTYYSLVDDALCDYCAGSLPERQGGLDRVDSSRGYTPDNVVPCCKTCNSAKSSLSLEEFRAWVRRVYQNIG